MYAAYKNVVVRIAEDLSPEDAGTIRYTQDLPSDPSSSRLALDTLACLERKGEFSCYNIEPLEAILSSASRHDLVTKHIDPFKRQYSEAGATAMQVPHHGSRKRRSRERHTHACTSAISCERSPDSPQRRWSIACSPSASAHYPSLESHSINEDTSNQLVIPSSASSVSTMSHEDEHPAHFQASVSSGKFPTRSASSGSLCVYTTPVTRRKMFPTDEQRYDQDPDTTSQCSNLFVIDDTEPGTSPPVAAEHGYPTPQVHGRSTTEPLDPQAGATHLRVRPDEPQHGATSGSSTQHSTGCSSETPSSQASPTQFLATVVERQHQGEAAGTQDIERSWCVVDQSTDIPAGQCSQSWSVKRSELCTVICNHREDKFIRLGKLTLKLNNSQYYLKFTLRLYPCGKGDDLRRHFVTLGVETVVPSKYLEALQLMRIKMSCRVECPDIDTEEQHAESEVRIRQCFNVHALVSDVAIIRSRSSYLTVHVTANVLPVAVQSL